MKKKACASLLSATLLLQLVGGGHVASASRMNQLEQEKKEINAESSVLDGKIGDTESDMAALEDERSGLEAEVSEIQQAIDDIVEKIAGHQTEIARLEEEDEKLNEKVDELRDQIAKRSDTVKDQARTVQVKGSPENIVDLILSSDSMTDLFSRMDLISTLIGSNFRIIEDQKRDEKQMEESLAKLAANKKRAEVKREELEIEENNMLARRVELDVKVEAVADAYDLTAEKRAAFIAEHTDLASRSSQLSAEQQSIRDALVVEQEAERKRQVALAQQTPSSSSSSQATVSTSRRPSGSSGSNNNGGSTSTPQNPSVPLTPPASSSSGFIRPARGYLSNPYGPNNFYASGFHDGVDIAGSGPIIAAKGGTVTAAGFNGVAGNYVVIDHGEGVSTFYAHMQPGLHVSPGQSVSQGQTLGIMGTTGFSTGVHLHFEVRINGRPVNPAGYIPL